MFEDVTSRYDLSDATIEIIIMLLIAFLLGLLLGYLLTRGCCKDCDDTDSIDNSRTTNGSLGLAEMDSSTTTTTSVTAEEDPSASISEGTKPSMLLSVPDGDADDLKRISGVGPVLEKVLNETGIFHFRQIVDLSDDNIKWLDNSLAFPGRIERENWVGQSKDLMKGVETDFAKRYAKGETTSNT